MPDAPAASASPHKKLVLIDGNSLLYRGFFAMRTLTTTAGQPTNAVFSFTMMLLTLLEQQKPDLIIAAWDTSQPTFRHEEYAAYKGQRSAPPSELTSQGPIARELLTAFDIPMVAVPGFEADDIIGTLSDRAHAQGYEVLIVTGDLDALQLVKPGVRVMTTVKGVTDVVIYDEAAVLNRYGLRPDQLADYRALKGDTSDNIPGVPGVGEKTAATVLQKFDHVENLLEHLGEVTPPKLQAALNGAKDQITQSKRLAVIVRDVPLDLDIPALDAEPHNPDWEKVRALFERLEFRQMMRRIPKLEAGGSTVQRNAGSREERSPLRGAEGGDLESEDYDPFADTGAEADTDSPAVAAKIEEREADTPDKRKEMVEAARKAYRVGVRLQVDDGALDACIFGVALAVGDGVVYYVPVQGPPKGTSTEEKPATNGTPNLFDEPTEQGETPRPEPRADLPAELIAVLEDPKVPKVTHDAKSDITVLQRYGVKLQNIAFDTELAAYLLNAGRRSGYPLVEIARDYANRELTILDKKTRKGMDAEAQFAHDRSEAIKSAEAILAVRDVQEPRLGAEKLTGILEDLELPVAPILAEMELAGLAIDVGVMRRIAGELQAKIDALEKQIFEIAGQEFAIGSIKQLQEILFEKLKLPAAKKTKTGYSTSADVLEELAPDYPIVSLILSHRELTKLKSTYTDAMPLLVRPDTGRLHTTLNQAVAATGRLSSSNPNLQNIPVRTAIGREIRRAFIAPLGKVLVSADYSQIELRIFAHVSKDPELVAAFSSGEDIHKYTAGRMYRVPVAEVTTDQRRAAKTVNYAVIYGISDFALGRRLGISMTAAKELKTAYFERFPGVKTFIDETIAFAREHGYVQTLIGRRRWMPDITSRVFQFRQAAERAAANMPIQGLSADIMKRAMISVHDMMQKEKFAARMLLQVHDELLFEAPPEEVNPLASKVQACMTTAFPLDVALEVEVKTGATWADVTPVEDLDALAEPMVV